MTNASDGDMRSGLRTRLGIRAACPRMAVAFVAAVALAQLAWADADGLRCAPADWDSFASASVSVQGPPRGGNPSTSMKIETSVHDDGSLVAAEGDGPRLEVIWWDGPEGRVALGNVASAPLQLSEASMLLEVPLAVVKQRFRALCGLHERTPYAVEAGSGRDAVSGHVERDGDSVSFDLIERRGRDQIRYTGSLAYKRSRGTLPVGLSIAGWTILHGSVASDGERSGFATLGDLEKGVVPPR